MPPAKIAPAGKKAAAPAGKKAAAKKAAAPGKQAAPVAKQAAPSPKKAAPAKSAPAKAAPAVTVTLKQIAAELAEGHDLPKKQAETCSATWWPSPPAT